MWVNHTGGKPYRCLTAESISVWPSILPIGEVTHEGNLTYTASLVGASNGALAFLPTEPT